MKSLRAQGILQMGEIVQVELLPVEGTDISGYKLICAMVPPAPAAHQAGQTVLQFVEKKLSPAGVPRRGPGSDLGTRTHLRNMPYPRQKREFW